MTLTLTLPVCGSRGFASTAPRASSTWMAVGLAA